MEKKKAEAVVELAMSLTQVQWSMIFTILGVPYAFAFGEKVNLLKTILGGYHGKSES